MAKDVAERLEKSVSAYPVYAGECQYCQAKDGHADDCLWLVVREAAAELRRLQGELAEALDAVGVSETQRFVDVLAENSRLRVALEAAAQPFVAVVYREGGRPTMRNGGDVLELIRAALSTPSEEA